MWEALRALAELGLALLQALKPVGKQSKEQPTAIQRDAAIGQESGATASREGKLAAKKARGD
jgi:hypothetical protein